MPCPSSAHTRKRIVPPVGSASTALKDHRHVRAVG
jgi:hypothetical protein